MKRRINWTTYLFLFFFILLLGISLLLMYHSQFISNLYINHFKKQALWIFCGFITFGIVYLIPSKYWFRWGFKLYLLNVLLLVAVLIWGVNTNGAKAWLKIGGLQFQPSEFMKFTYSLFLANFCSNRIFYNIKDEFKFLVKVLLIFIIPSVLVFLEPDTGAILFLLAITIILLWKTKISRKWFTLFVGLVLGIIGGFFYCFFFNQDILISLLGTSFFYRVERLLEFGKGMQIENALIALGSAPLWRFNLDNVGIYIPEAPTDFVFALASNVLGLAGPLIILICYLVIDFCFIEIYNKEQNKPRKLFILSFLTIFLGSQLENIGMNLGVLPIIGIPLPFLSYGGSCMIMLFAFLGVIFQQRKSFTKKGKTFKIDYL